MRFLKHLGVLMMGFLLFGGCTLNRNLSSSNLHEIYRNDNSPSPSFRIYHLNDSVARVYFKINSSKLLYAKKEGEKYSKSNVKFSYHIYDGYDSETFTDSASIRFSDFGFSEPARELIGNFEIPMSNNLDRLIEIETTDLYRQKSDRAFLPILRKSKYSRQHFLLTDPETGTPFFEPYFTIGQKVRITYSGEASKLYGRHYQRQFPIALAPFALYNPKPFNYAADSLFTLPFSDSNTVDFLYSDSGFFHFSTNAQVKTGLSLFEFGKSFPRSTSAEDLLFPLRFVMTRTEFMELRSNPNPKEALDNFWLTSTPNPDRAKELIRKYYKRVEEANRHFTSYMEGWQTDRGMIYIVFGPPNIIYKSANSESWVYGEENNYMSLTLNFIKVNNPFTSNDFRLNRSPIYKNNWYRAVESWRQGRVLVNN